MLHRSFLRRFLLLATCLILLVATCGYSAPTKVVRFRPRPLHLSEKLLEMFNEHFHTFSRPRFRKRLHSSYGWMHPLPPQEVNDALWTENFEPSYRNPLPEPMAPEFIIDANDDDFQGARNSGLLRSPGLDHNRVHPSDGNTPWELEPVVEICDDNPIGAMSMHTVECGRARRFEIKSELEKRLSQINFEVLDPNHRQVSLHTRAREQGLEHRSLTAEHALDPIPLGGGDKEVYKRNVMLIIDAAKKYRMANKTEENHLIEAATNMITRTTMFSQK